MNLLVNSIETNSIVTFAVNYSDGVLGKVLEIVSIGAVPGKVLDVVLPEENDEQ